MKVIFDSYTKVSSLKESTPCRGNSKGTRSNIVDDSMCIRLLYLAQNVIDTRTAENVVTVTRNDVKTNSDCPVFTGVSIPKKANSRMIQHYCGSAPNTLMSCYWLFAGSHNWVPASQHFFRLPNCTCCTGWTYRKSRTVH